MYIFGNLQNLDTGKYNESSYIEFYGVGNMTFW